MSHELGNPPAQFLIDGRLSTSLTTPQDINWIVPAAQFSGVTIDPTGTLFTIPAGRFYVRTMLKFITSGAMTFDTVDLINSHIGILASPGTLFASSSGDRHQTIYIQVIDGPATFKIRALTGGVIGTNTEASSLLIRRLG